MNIRKRLLSFIICGAMAFSAGPLKAFAEDDWFAPAVSFVSERNLMSGMGGGLFSPYFPFTKPFML